MLFSQLQQGVDYFSLGWRLVRQKGIRRYVIVPILFNIVFFSVLFWFFYGQIERFNLWAMGYLPHWLGWLTSVVIIFSTFIILFVYYLVFTLLTGFIGSPFYGLLSEKLEILLTHESTLSGGWLDFIRDLPRLLLRETQKLMYSLPRFLLLFCLSFIPILGQSVMPVLLYLFSAWMMAIQYCDYPFDNHKIPFKVMRQQLAEKRIVCVTFGGLVALCGLIPFVNILVMPVAVCSATALWVDYFRDHPANKAIKRHHQEAKSAMLLTKE